LRASLTVSAHAIRRDSCHGSASGATLSTTTNRRAANGSTEASSNVNSMASAAEEMTASVREISHQVQERRAWRAMPTGKATGEIGEQISGIQSATQESVAARD
jgi:hypothetical protein